MRPSFTLITILALTWTNSVFAQTTASTPPPDWYMQDPESDHYQGISVEKAYQTLLKDRPSRTVIVAVIDSGVDIEHEDLKNSIWTNEDEIPGNGIDDDKNGYIDDVHGWNFIGGKEGNVNEDTYELTREYVRLKSKFKDTPEGKVERKQKKDYELFKTIRDKYEKRKAKEVAQFEAVKKQYTMYQAMEVNLKQSLDTLKTVLKKDKFTGEDLAGLQTNDPNLLFAKGLVTRLMKSTGQSDPDSLMNELDATVQYFKKGYDYYAVIVEYGYNENFDSRKIVGDDPGNLKERHYGNNDVAGPDADHGTHVAGIIAADRKNEIGIKGIADNVKIMSVRTVPNGDERDKDVANAIRYAVDNGANIINMSFGKSWSPQKEVVDEAVKYAEKKGVLLVHAAGNDNQDIDKELDYPTRYLREGKEALNWLEVGASTWKPDETLPASFSNYGKKTVDIFAPGEEIYSTNPGNKYSNMDGTSFACPMTAGVAALLMSYFPDLTIQQVVQVIKQSSRKFDGLKVQKPGGGKADFSDLSNTGGLLNAYEAVKAASELKGRMTIK